EGRGPDLVVSGMSSGTSVGINVIYSGTVAAAIEGAFLGLPSIAVSLYLRGDVSIDSARSAKLAVKAIQKVLAAGLRAGQCVTINLPALRDGEHPTGTKVV